MKKVLLLIILLITVQSVSAQLFSKERVLNNENFDKPRLSYGYYLGFNVYDYNIDYATWICMCFCLYRNIHEHFIIKGLFLLGF